MLPRNVLSLLSVLCLLSFVVACPGRCTAQELDLSGLSALEAPQPVLAGSAAPLDLSGLDDLASPLAAVGGLNLQCLEGLDCPCPDGCRCVGECRCERPPVNRKPEIVNQPAAQLVLPAARPPAAVTVTTAQPAGGQWVTKCTKKACKLVKVSKR